MKKDKLVLTIIAALILFIAGIMFGISLKTGNNNFSLSAIALCIVSVCVLCVSSISLSNKEKI
jgi:drug/metabolite transporter (DMT)-like permease